jgi:hypothetical protein
MAKQQRSGGERDRVIEPVQAGSMTREMTQEQKRTLKRLASEGREPEAFRQNLSAEGAEQRIRVLKTKLAKDKSGDQHKPD